MTLSAEQRAIVAEAQRIKREKNRERRQTIKAARKPGGKADRGRVREPGYLAFLRRQPCAALGMGFCGGPIQAAHIRYRDARYPNSAGAQVKNHDRWANPLCATHHEMQHNCGNERRFWEMIGKDAYETAAANYAAYRGQTPLPVETSQAGMEALQAPECTHKIQSEQTNG